MVSLMAIIARRQGRGVTLIELMVAIAVFMILGSALITMRPSSDNTDAVQSAAHLLASDFRRLQNKAQSGVLFEDSLPEGGYGVRLDRTTLELASQYGLVAENGDHRYQPVNDPLLPAGSKKFYGNVTFFGLWINRVVSEDKTLLLAFSPTQADVFVSTETGLPLAGAEVCIVLRTRTGASSSVHVNGQSGQVEVLTSCP